MKAFHCGCGCSPAAAIAIGYIECRPIVYAKMESQIDYLGYILHFIPFNQFIESVIQLASDGSD
jgi:hypothetical protein